MPNRFTIPGLKTPKLSGWPLVGVLGVGLALIALLYGGAMGKLDSSCRMTVLAQVSVRSTPSPSGRAVETLAKNDEVTAEKIVDSGFRKLTGGDRWVPSNAVASTSQNC